MKRKNIATLLIASLIAISLSSSITLADIVNPVSGFGSGLEAVGNFFQGLYLFFYNSGYILVSVFLFVFFFALEIGLIYLYWAVGSTLYNRAVPFLKKIANWLENIA